MPWAILLVRCSSWRSEGTAPVVRSDEALRPSTPVAQLPGKPESIFDGVDTPFQLGTNNERGLDPKNRIALQKFVAVEEQMSDEGAITRRADHEMNVCGSEWMSSHCREQLARGTVIRNWITDRHDGSESIGTCRIGAKARPQVTLWLIPVLDVIQLIGSSLPNLYQCVRDRLPLGIGDAATHHQRLALLLPKQDTVALSELALVTGIEWAEDCGVTDAGTRYIVHRVNQHRNAQNVREQDKLLAAFGTHLAGTRKEVDGLPPLALRYLRFPHDRMQMADYDLHDLLQFAALRTAHAIDDVARQFWKDFLCWSTLLFAGHDPHLHSCSRRPAAVICVIEKGPDRTPLDCARIPVSGLERRIGSLVEVGFRHPDLPQRSGRAIQCRKIKQCARSFMRAKRARHTIKGGRCGAGIVRSGMRQDHGVGFCVRKTEGASQHVTQLVMERHPYSSEARSTDPGSKQSIGASAPVGRV